MANNGILKILTDNRLVEKEESNKLDKMFNGNELDIVNHLYVNEQILEEKILIGRLYSDYLDKAHVNLRRAMPQSDALSKIDHNFASTHHCAPLKLLNNILTVVMSKPLDTAFIKEIESTCGHKVHSEFAFQDDIDDFIAISYGTRANLKELSSNLIKEIPKAAYFDPSKLEQLAGLSGVIDLVDSLLRYCLKYNASDIHIQPSSKRLLIRYRIDGVLQTMLEIDKALNAPIISRLKVMANLDVTEKRFPADGRVSLEMAGISRDFRLSTVPSIRGEKAVIRAIGQSSDKTFPKLEHLGFSDHNLSLIEKLIKCPNGVLFVTGPTGSGKTTTLYSILSRLNAPEINIITVEDPVEYRMDGITQIQTNPAIKLDFSTILRSILRQDPQVILIGEIRDPETAKIASEAALTGHLVMATMHTNSAIQAVTRLVEIGVEPFLVAPSVIGVVGQHLVRKICEHCKESFTPTAEVTESLSLEFAHKELTNTEFKLYRGTGCNHCHSTGYSGRIPIHEVFLINDYIRQLISENASILQIQQESKKYGFRPMREDGLEKILLGITTLDEVNRVTQEVEF